MGVGFYCGLFGERFGRFGSGGGGEGGGEAFEEAVGLLLFAVVLEEEGVVHHFLFILLLRREESRGDVRVYTRCIGCRGFTIEAHHSSLILLALGLFFFLPATERCGPSC